MDCDIFVVRYNQPKLEKRCVVSVEKHTDLTTNRLTVVDNYSRKMNLGVLWNQLIAGSDKRFICLLNSDTEVTQGGWIDKLTAVAMEQNAAVGPLTNKCGIHFQVASQAGAGDPREVPTLSGFCLVFPRSLWIEADGFREDFPFYGQESNFLARVARKLVVPSVFVRHKGGASMDCEERRLEESTWGAESHRRNLSTDWKQKLCVIGARGPQNPFPLWRGLSQALREFEREGMRSLSLAVDDQDLRWKLLDFSPDLVVVISQNPKHFQHAHEAIRKSELNPTTAVWFNDLRKPMGTPFHHVFLCWQGSWGLYDSSTWGDANRASKLWYMPQGCQLRPSLLPVGEILNPQPLFIGSIGPSVFHEDRAGLMKYLRAEVINSAERDRRVAIERGSEGLYRQRKFCLAVSPSAPGYSSIRLYNILSYGGFALTKHFPGVEKLFENGRHIAWFRSQEQATEIIEHYNSRAEEHDAVRWNGWRLSQAKHTVSHRLLNIIHNMTGQDDTFWGYL